MTHTPLKQDTKVRDRASKGGEEKVSPNVGRMRNSQAESTRVHDDRCGTGRQCAQQTASALTWRTSLEDVMLSETSQSKKVKAA